MHILENFLYILESFDSEKGYVKSITNIEDIEKISVEFSKPNSLFHSVLAIDICRKFKTKPSVIKSKIYEFERNTQNKASYDVFFSKLQEINKEIKIFSQIS